MLVDSNRYFVLDEDRNVVPFEGTILEWAERHEKSEDRIVKQQKVCGFWISTVFLSLDHGYFPDRPPVVFETMVFRGKESDLWCQRSCTYEEALRTHEEAVKEFSSVVGWLRGMKL